VVAGDELYMTLASRQTLYLYILNEDATHSRQILYPCREWSRNRPLAASRRLRLPPPLLGRETFWPVRTVTAHEHLLVLTSTQPVAPLEDAVLASSPESPCAAALNGGASRWLDELSAAGREDDRSRFGWAGSAGFSPRSRAVVPRDLQTP
jgi:hypothetical protein